MNTHELMVQCIFSDDHPKLSALLDNYPDIDLDRLCEGGLTYAQLAASYARESIVDELEKRGANMQTKNENGHNVRASLRLRLIDIENNKYEHELQSLMDAELLNIKVMEEINKTKD